MGASLVVGILGWESWGGSLGARVLGQKLVGWPSVCGRRVDLEECENPPLGETQKGGRL